MNLVCWVVVLLFIRQESFKITFYNNTFAHFEMLVSRVFSTCFCRLNHLELYAVSVRWDESWWENINRRIATRWNESSCLVKHEWCQCDARWERKIVSFFSINCSQANWNSKRLRSLSRNFRCVSERTKLINKIPRLSIVCERIFLLPGDLSTQTRNEIRNKVERNWNMIQLKRFFGCFETE